MATDDLYGEAPDLRLMRIEFLRSSNSPELHAFFIVSLLLHISINLSSAMVAVARIIVSVSFFDREDVGDVRTGDGLRRTGDKLRRTGDVRSGDVLIDDVVLGDWAVDILL